MLCAGDSVSLSIVVYEAFHLMASNAELSHGGHGEQKVQPLDPSDEARITHELHTHRAGQNIVLNQYERLRRIGTGQHGEVYVAWDMITSNLVAIKGMKRKNPREDKMKLLRKSAIQASPHTPLTERLGTTENKIRKEIAIMKKCRHPHVVRLLEVIDDRMKHKIYMVMEFLGGGEIKWRNTQHEPILHVDQVRRICRDAILGLEYLHYQGIIHRDIKPANLLWTENRQQVKISDFGVSHFSRALRMAATGSEKAALEGSSELRLVDDSDMSKRAGTPSFLAPEVIYEYKNIPSHATSENPFSSSEDEHPASTLHLPLVKPPVTKSIDVWALGITLYCLLFGRVPFYYSGDNAFRTYVLIANSDWDADETMGFDRVATRGRHPSPGDHSEGATVMRILDKMLQKDANDRMTLDEFKNHPWITRDIQGVEEWLHATSPGKNDVVVVDEIETQSAMSSIHYRYGWHKRIKHRISSILHTVRPHRSSRSVGQTSEERYGADSAPHLRGDRYKQDAKQHGAEPHKKGKKADHGDKGKGVDPLEKGKGRAKNRPKSARNESGSTVASTSASRGSETLLVPEGSEYVSHSPETGSPTSIRTGDEHLYSTKRQGIDRPRSRFSVRSFRWRSHKNPSHGSTPTEPSTSALSSGAESLTHVSNHTSRRSTEAISNSIGRFSPVIFARRASIWADGEYEDVLSLNSGGDDEGPERDTIMFGAGGVSNHAPYGTSAPAGLTRAAAAASDVTPTHHQSQLERFLIGNPTLATTDPASYHKTVARHGQIRAQNASPGPLADEARHSNVDLEDTCDERSDDDSLSYGEVVTNPYQSGTCPCARSCQMYGEEDADDSDEDSAPILVKVKHRRASVTARATPSTPPFNGEPL